MGRPSPAEAYLPTETRTHERAAQADTNEPTTYQPRTSGRQPARGHKRQEAKAAVIHR